MIKRTLYIENEVYCFVRDGQFYVEYPSKTDIKAENRTAHVPLEDIGMLILDHPQIRLSTTLFSELFEANVAVVFCDRKHMPVGLSQAFSGNHLHQAIVEAQLAVSEPLKKQLWQQTIVAKINNQAALLQKICGQDADALFRFAKAVKSGDLSNLEGRAAKVYWKLFFPTDNRFNRDPEGAPPNNALNYGYAILRSITARALVGSGLLPVVGLFHRNQYNPFCLADDVMEPYRIYVDGLVRQMTSEGLISETLSKEVKLKLAQMSTCDVLLENKQRPLMVAMQHTAASLAKCYQGTARKIIYPTF